METFVLQTDIPVFGFQVKEFPIGIPAAFDSLVKMIPEGYDRSYFGISYFSDNAVSYFVAVSEGFEGEATYYPTCNTLTIKNGHYKVTPIVDWQSKTDMISDVFTVMMKNIRVDKSRPCIEWYKDADEMYCMIRKD